MSPDKIGTLSSRASITPHIAKRTTRFYDSDKNRLLGSELYNSGRPVSEPNPWAGSDFEEKMAMLLVWANLLNRAVQEFTEGRDFLSVRIHYQVGSSEMRRIGKPQKLFLEPNSSARSAIYDELIH